MICVTHGKVYAVHKGTGEKLWRALFPVSLFGAPLSSVFVTDRDSVLMAANGTVTCLYLFTGLTKWTHKMKVGNTYYRPATFVIIVFKVYVISL